MRNSAFLIGAVVVAGAVALSSIFIVDEREKALVLQFGEIVRVEENPGLRFKIPFIQEVVTYDDRILSRDMSSLEVTDSNNRRAIVDAFARYKIDDAEAFRRAVGAGGESTAADRLDAILRAKTRQVLGTVTQEEILSPDRAALTMRIRNAATDEARSLGLQVIDVRLKRTDLPQSNLVATYNRMAAAREQVAADLIARGEEAAQRIRAAADREVTELVSDAERQAQIIRGEADAERNGILAEAYGADPDFFAFQRSMNAYVAMLEGGKPAMVLSPDNDFFRFLNSEVGE